MADTTTIEWADATFNPWMGCTKISPACDNCYASVSTPVRTMAIPWDVGQPRKRTSAANWKQPQPDLYRVGKKAAGRLLDGVTHDEVPHG